VAPRSYLTIALLAGVLAGCGSQKTSVETDTGPTTSAAETGTTASTTAPTLNRTTFRVYLLRNGQVAPVRSEVEPTRAVARAALEQLIAGPTADERAAGLTTDVPADAAVRGLTIADGTATVDLSREFTAAAEASISLRLAQVVFTLTQFPSVSSVSFEVEGQPLPTTDGIGQPLDRPAQRSDYEALTPPLLVESPLPGDMVTSPLRLSGTANAFEATFQAKLLGASGQELARRTVTATSGSGERGTFDATLAFQGEPGALELVVWEDSAENGKPIHVVEVPLRLAR
jgi:germination protein M